MRMKAQLAAGLLAGVAASSAGAVDDPAPHTHTLPLVLAAGTGLHGFVRVINHSDEAGTVQVEAIDDTGGRYGPVTLDLKARQVVHFNSRDLEDGNAAKGLSAGSKRPKWAVVSFLKID